MQTTLYNFEIKRKTFHICSLILPLLYLPLPKSYMIAILLLLTLIVLFLDTSRHYSYKIQELTNKIFTKLMREEEKNGSFKLSGSSYMFFGFFLSALFFSKGLAITSWLVLIISDALAALVGTKIGTPLSNGKTIAGSVAFMVSAVLISILCYFFIGYDTNFFIILLSCLISTICEFFSKQISINDNFLIPLIYALSNVIFAFIFGL